MQLSSSDNFRIQRVVTWLQPDKHMAEGGYQVMQGLYAIGSGGFWGKGLGNSVQKLSAIPEVQNDMILAAICEELGIFGAIVIPTTGITLPFFSYGGTSILFLMSEMGLALGVSRTIKFEET